MYIDTIAGTYEYQIIGKPVWVPPGDTAVLAPVPAIPGRGRAGG